MVFKVLLTVLMLGCSFGLTGIAEVKASPSLVFEGAVIDSDLLPLVEEFIDLAQGAGIGLPFANKVTHINIVPHAEMLASIRSRGDIMAVTIIERREARILLSENLLHTQELRVLLFHELLHAAGFDHPPDGCHWNKRDCGIMGHSTYPHVRLDRDRADHIIRTSFRKRYLAKLPLIDSH